MAKQSSRKSPRLQFTDEERSTSALEKPIRKVDKAAAKTDKAQAEIPKQTVKTNERVVDPKTGKITTRVVFEDKKKPPSKLSHAVKAAPVRELKSQVHKEIGKSEGDNVGVESAHKLEETAETGARLVQSAHRSHALTPYRKAAVAENRLEKANINALQKQSLSENPHLSSNPISRWQQKQAIKKQYAAAKKSGEAVYGTAANAQKSAKRAKKAAEKTEKTGRFIYRHRKGIAIVLGITMVVVMLASSMSSCSVMLQGGMSAIVSTTYPSKESDMLATEAAYAGMEAALQYELDNYETLHPGYDEYVYNLDLVAHDPHALAAYLSAMYQGYTLNAVRAELQNVFELQYVLSENVTVETRYRDETTTDPTTGETTTERVPYEYKVMTVTLRNNWIASVATARLSSSQLEMYNIYRTTLGNMPLLFGGGSGDYSPSVDISGVVFINGERLGNQAVVDIGLSQVGNVGGQPYWSWYGWESRVAWCACFVSWCINQAGASEPFFAYCPFGANWFSQQGQWARRGYEHIAPGDVIFFDWEPDGSTDHVGIVIGKDATHVYTVEGNTGDSVKVKSYPLDSSVIYGYGLMNW